MRKTLEKTFQTLTIKEISIIILNEIKCLIIGRIKKSEEEMRQIINLNENWEFYKGVADAGAVRENAEKVCLPHSWNAQDGQDGGNDYFRGSCLYVKSFVKGICRRAINIIWKSTARIRLRTYMQTAKNWRTMTAVIPLGGSILRTSCKRKRK